MSDDECEEWVGWVDIPPKQVVRMRGRIQRVITRDEARALLAEGKRAADEKRKAREARERDPERAR